MTSHKSLKNNFGFAFRSSLGSSIMPLFELVGLAFFYTIIPIISLTQISRSDEGVVSRASEKFTYLFLSDSSMLITLIIFGVIMCSVLTGLSTFKFATGKKMVNVYYSLGIKRDKLYAAKFLSGLVKLVLAVFLPLTATFFTNIALCGISKYLVQAYFFQMVALFAISFICYSITTAVCASVGTIFEGGVFSAVLILFPTLLFVSIEKIASSLLLGSAYGIYFGNSYYSDSVAMTSLSDKFTLLNPIKFAQSALIQYSGFSKDLKFLDSNAQWSAPNFLPSFIWIIAAIAVFFVGMYFFQRRKAEIGGFIGTNKVMNFICTFIVGFAVFSLTVSLVPVSNAYLLVLIGLAAFFIVYCIFDFAFIRNFKEFFRGMKKLPVHLGITLLIGVLVATGFFGLSYKLPAVDDIQYASISGASYDSTFGLCSDTNYNYSVGNTTISAFSLGEFTDKDDIQKVLSINKALYDDGFLKENYASRTSSEDLVYKTPVYITYKLKDGSVVKKYFKYSSSAVVKQMLEIENTKYLKERQQEILIGKKSTFDTTKFKGNFTLAQSREAAFAVAQSIVQGSESKIMLFSSTLDTQTLVSLTDAQRLALRQALAKDLAKRTVEQKYLSNKDSILGIVAFSGINTVSEVTNQNVDISYQYSSVASSEQVTEVAEYNMPSASNYWTNERNFTLDIMFYASGVETHFDYYITADMTNTVALLKEYGIYKFLEPSAEVKEVLVYANRDRLALSKYEFQYYNLNPIITARNGYLDENGTYSQSPYQYKTTDAAEISRLISSSNLISLDDGNGYTIVVKYKNPDYPCSYLNVSSDDMPKDIISKLSTDFSFDNAGNQNYYSYY